MLVLFVMSIEMVVKPRYAAFFAVLERAFAARLRHRRRPVRR